MPSIVELQRIAQFRASRLGNRNRLAYAVDMLNKALDGGESIGFLALVTRAAAVEKEAGLLRQAIAKVVEEEQERIPSESADEPREA